MLYTLDTNVYIDAIRQPAEMERLQEFLSWALPVTTMSSVVASELLAGARSDAARRVIEQELVAPFARRGRLREPSADAWMRAGVVLGRHGGTRVGAAWQNDLLLAATARELGWTVVTRDKDFARIRTYVKGLRVVAAYPGRSRRR